MYYIFCVEVNQNVGQNSVRNFGKINFCKACARCVISNLCTLHCCIIRCVIPTCTLDVYPAHRSFYPGWFFHSKSAHCNAHQSAPLGKVSFINVISEQLLCTAILCSLQEWQLKKKTVKAVDKK